MPEYAKTEGKLAKKPRLYPSLVIEQIKGIERDFGGREGLCAALSLAPSSPDVDYFLGQLGDPRNSGQSLAEICARSGMLPGHLLLLVMDAGKLVARARAAHLAQAGITPVIQDILRRAAPFEQDCPTCMVDGTSTGRITPDPTPQKLNPSPEPCPDCRGALRLLHLPDLSRQELALDLANLLPKGGGFNIAVQQNNSGGGGSGHTRLLDEVTRLAEGSLYDEMPAAPPVEGEILPPDPQE